jgi:hypothetical protein
MDEVFEPRRSGMRRVLFFIFGTRPAKAVSQTENTL